MKKRMKAFRCVSRNITTLRRTEPCLFRRFLAAAANPEVASRAPRKLGSTKKRPDWWLGYNEIMQDWYSQQGPERLVAERRQGHGAKACSALREQGFVPGILQGMGQDPVLITLEKKRVMQLLRSEEGFSARNYYLDFEGQVLYVKPMNLLRNPYTGQPQQVTLLRQPMPNEEVKSQYLPLTGDQAPRW